jgi:Asp-tRNA(Asn)/Glu-tRNA(Gln) amidotransferase A subunit family amidase
MRGDARALEGIPTSLKDEDAIAGRPVTADSVLMKDNRRPRRAPCGTPDRPTSHSQN